ncbi:MAG: hypothetical protein LC754_09220 [Acidobacteria bacterium]|nr:hypothetical protein [Acidobacteriota bacterium]
MPAEKRSVWPELMTTCVEIVPPPLNRISPAATPKSLSAALIFAPRSAPGKSFATRVALLLCCAAAAHAARLKIVTSVIIKQKFLLINLPLATFFNLNRSRGQT